MPRRARSGFDSLWPMCRSIRPLNNFEPPATDDEVHAAALQFVRKVSGGRDPSQANREAFDVAVQSIAGATRTLVDSLVTIGHPSTPGFNDPAYPIEGRQPRTA